MATMPQPRLATLVTLLVLLTTGCFQEEATAPKPDATAAICGNQRLDPGEECEKSWIDDQGVLNEEPIFWFGICFVGDAVCGKDCKLAPGSCSAYCGDGKIYGNEECDGETFAVRCPRGPSVCNADCTLDRTRCIAECGDGVISFPDEQCDGNLFLSPCHDSSGALSCEQCVIIPNGCTAGFCGDGVKNGPEACDRTAPTCHDKASKIRCSADCKLELNGCKAYCGDGLRNGPEECDGADTPKCHDTSGKVTCDKQCLTQGSCLAYCGDGAKNGPEQCDGPETPTCHNSSGVVTCTKSCTIDKGGCNAYCGDGIRNGPEECDGNAKPCAAAVCYPDCSVDDSMCP